MRPIYLGTFLAMAIAPASSFAANNNDWPNVKKDCDAVLHSTVPTPLWKRFMACGSDFFTARPVHLTVKSIVPGGGFGLGPTFSQPFNRGKWQQELDATGVGTFSKFWSTEAKFLSSRDKFGQNNSARDRFAYEIYARARDLPDMVYHGIGPNTSLTDVANFHERDISAGADVYNPFSSWFAAGGRIESLWTDIGAPTSGSNVIPIAAVYHVFSVPGLASQPNLIHYEIYGEPRRTRHKFQFDYKVGYDFYQDHDTGQYSFRRFKVDGTHTFHPTGRDEDILTIHDRLSLASTASGNVVPFYLQETLGGSDINGQPTLRGFADYRFRGPDLTLIQVEYDQRIWGPVGLLGFYDTGQVALEASELSLAKMRHSFGFGLSVWAGNRAVFKVYVGLGSGEGSHTYVGIPAF